MAGVALAALTAGGRKAFGGIKPQLVALNAFENELGVQAPVGLLTQPIDTLSRILCSIHLEKGFMPLACASI